MRGVGGGWVRAALLCTVGVLAATAHGQIELSVRPEHPRVLQREQIRVRCRITNRGFEPLRLGVGGNAELQLVVERKPGYQVRGSGASVIGEPVVVKPRKGITIPVPLHRSHDVSQTGPYTLFARLVIDGEIYRSSPAYVDVLPGLVLASVRAAVPGADRERRTFTLRTLMRDQAQHLFLRIDDAGSSRGYGVFDLGRYLSYFSPQLDVDGEGRIHVLHLSSPTRYNHSIYGPNGQPISAEFHRRHAQPARLAGDGTGRLRVEGAPPYAADTADTSAPGPTIRTSDPFQ